MTSSELETSVDQAVADDSQAWATFSTGKPNVACILVGATR